MMKTDIKIITHSFSFVSFNPSKSLYEWKSYFSLNSRDASKHEQKSLACAQNHTVHFSE